MEEEVNQNKGIMVSLRHLTKSFGKGETRVVAVNDFTFDFPPGKLSTLLGPSGCGKTTVLRCLAGFYEPDQGDVIIGGDRVNDLPPYKRPTGTVFQHYALFPHLTVFENVAYGLRVKKLPKKEIKEKVAQALKLLQLPGLEYRNPNQLSGGQQQRVAIARVLVNEPEVLLFDEPLSNLDAKLRVYMRGEIRALQERLGITALYVTHDQEEAMSISHTLVIMNKGNIEQSGTPLEIYRQPETPFVAEFIGMTNFLKGEVEGVDDHSIKVRVHRTIISIPLAAGLDQKFHQTGQKVLLVSRPEMIRFAEGTGERGLSGKVQEVSFLGSLARYVIEMENGEQIRMDEPNPKRFREKGSIVHLLLDEEALHLQKAD
jgi:ABC-type Fe3+/spermidine/putrescine transport system ATPase subunit